MKTRFTLPDIENTDRLFFLRFLAYDCNEKTAFCDGMRPLTGKEVEQLRLQGNRASDWSAIRVSNEFSAEHISNSRFFGACFLGKFDGSFAESVGGLSLPCGIYDSIITDSVISDGCRIWGVKGLKNYFVGRNAVLFNVGTLSCSRRATFGNGREIVIGIETGGREVPSFADMTIEIAEVAATRRLSAEEYRSFIDKYLHKVTIGFGVVESGCHISNCSRIIDSFIGSAAICDGAALIENSTILSSPEEQTIVESGAYVRNSCIQWGCHVSSMAIVDESVMTEHSHAERHGKITHSIIGPNTGIAEGEVTASLVGPFVGFHHQALLIGALWPEGKGNVAYGANVGSNHTSKAPDQEIFCGEGVFFGLGVNIKFPADYSGAPYSIIATGITTLPQRVSFPFSLINSPSRRFDEIPPAYNELFPAWVLSDNLYTIARNEGKYAKRNKARRSTFTFEVFRPEIIDLMVNARDKLRKAPIKEVYTETHIEGIGKNFLTRESLVKGMETYSQYIERYCLGGLFRECKNLIAEGKVLDQHTLLNTKSGNPRWEHERLLILSEGFDKRTLRENLQRLAELTELSARSIFSAKEKDDIRGRMIIDDYDEVHTPASEDEFVKETRGKCSAFVDEITCLIKLIPR